MTTTFATQADPTQLEEEREHLTNQAIAIATAAHEMAVMADLFSARIRSPRSGVSDSGHVESHLAQVRRNCAEAQHRADAVRRKLVDQEVTWIEVHTCDEDLRDAQTHLTLSDYAYDRACEAIVHR